jgi:hypothetical protein
MCLNKAESLMELVLGQIATKFCTQKFKKIEGTTPVIRVWVRAIARTFEL